MIRNVQSVAAIYILDYMFIKSCSCRRPCRAQSHTAAAPPRLGRTSKSPNKRTKRNVKQKTKWS
ncbi:unnamed protein product [Arabidopsis lyrata]|nr:unnamed protein product [Arabidopsis lyrata]